MLPGIRLLPAPGHTAGHQVVLVDTDEGPVVLGGDVGYSFRELGPRRHRGPAARARARRATWLAHVECAEGAGAQAVAASQRSPAGSRSATASSTFPGSTARSPQHAAEVARRDDEDDRRHRRRHRRRARAVGDQRDLAEEVAAREDVQPPSPAPHLGHALDEHDELAAGLALRSSAAGPRAARPRRRPPRSAPAPVSSSARRAAPAAAARSSRSCAAPGRFSSSGCPARNARG